MVRPSPEPPAGRTFCGRPVRWITWLLLTAVPLWLNGVLGAVAEGTGDPISMVVMDPLAAELACVCVKGHGQRNYRRLASRLEHSLQERIGIEFSDDLKDTLAHGGVSSQLILIGDRSLVNHAAEQVGLKCRPLCELTDRDGTTSQPAVFLARSDDAVRSLSDLAGRTLLFGLPPADARHAAALRALRGAGVEASVTLELRDTFSTAALDLLDAETAPLPTIVVPGYALPMLEGCGTVPPGRLRVVGRSDPVPFTTVFVSEAVSAGRRTQLLKALLDVNQDSRLLALLESRDGFKVPPASAGPTTDWPDWRGPGRDGRVPRLPFRLPESPRVVWRKAATPEGLAGLSLRNGRLVVAGRDFADERDVYRCLDAETGRELWQVSFAAPGRLDYGQAPRATPMLDDERAYLLGAFGDLRCVRLTDGRVLWQRNLAGEFHGKIPTWGAAATPLLVDGLLIVNPGGPEAALAALDPATGKTHWTSPGNPAAYAAFLCGEFGGRRQLVGYDDRSLGGWDVQTGRRLWTLVPEHPGDFNVPTPVAAPGGLILSTENNGTRFHQFDPAGRILPHPTAVSETLAPDTATPVLGGGRLFGVHRGLHCLDVKQGLRTVWHLRDAALDEFGTLFSDGERVLAVALSGELILVDAQSDEARILSRARIFDNDVESYAHPALAGSRLFLRGGYSVVCVALDDP
ncbi:MAG: PQQ-binding-like beta-propeller repeat protein [Verrucomicrobiae bacterium]|nr:PQQ-binding-like beta-propeller repeat protein [Verrucomicrobiae bacterium]